MNTALCLLLYGAVVTWWGPTLLIGLTQRGVSPRLSILLWLSAIGVVSAAWVVVGVGLVLDVVRGRPDTLGFCTKMVAALDGHGGWGRVAVVVLGTSALAAVGGLSLVVVRRVVTALRRSGARSRDHAREARILGSTTRHPGVVVVPVDHPAAYCIAGRPPAIVVTAGALAALDDAELTAVLAHERAHVSGRHLQLMMLLRALATAMPRLPLFRSAVDSVGRLVEMCADDTAARRHGRQALLRGLVALAGPLPHDALGAGHTATLARALRLAVPLNRRAMLRQRLLLSATLAALFATPVAASAMCHA